MVKEQSGLNEQMIAEYKLTEQIFDGFKDRKEIAKCMKVIALFSLKAGNFWCGIYRGFSSRLPVIATSCGGPEELSIR